jgi:hypothetical protein
VGFLGITREKRRGYFLGHAGWKQTVQSLIERFQELFEPIQSPLGDIEEGIVGEDGGDNTEARAQRALALQQATQRITQNTMGLPKLRQHFNKVP